MRIEIAGAQITEAVVEVLENLQVEQDITILYLDTLDEITRMMILDITGVDEEDTKVLGRLRALQMIRRDIATLATPPDVDLPENDTPTASF